MFEVLTNFAATIHVVPKIGCIEQTAELCVSKFLTHVVTGVQIGPSRDFLKFRKAQNSKDKQASTGMPASIRDTESIPQIAVLVESNGDCEIGQNYGAHVVAGFP